MLTDAVAQPRVMFVSPVADARGGAEQVLLQMLATHDVAPVLAVPHEGSLSEAATALGVPVCFYRPSALQHVHRPPRLRPILAAIADIGRCAYRVRQLAAAYECEIIHSNGLKAHIINAVVARIARATTVVHLHDIPYRPVERLIWLLIGMSVRHVIAVSPPCYPFRASPRRLSILWNGVTVAVEPLRPVEPSRQLRIGFVGRFHPSKGLDLLLDWFDAVRSAGIDACLIVRGRPDPDVPAYWDRIRERIDAYADGVVQVRGWQQNGDI